MHSALLDFRHTGGDADGDARAWEAEAEVVMRGADEVLQHLLCDHEVRNDAVPQRAHSHDVRRGAADHALGLAADGQYFLVDAVDGDD